MAKIERKCLMCGKDFEVYESQVKRGGGKYCSISCGTTYRNLTNNPTKDPDVRKKISENHADVSGSNNPMYGKTGKECPNYKHGASEYGSYYRMVALKDKEKKCEDCDREVDGYQLHVHHIDENRENSTPSNLVILCAKCHSKRHGVGENIKRDSKGRFIKGSGKND